MALGEAAAAWPLASRAQQGERMRRISVLMNRRGTSSRYSFVVLPWLLRVRVRTRLGCCVDEAVGAPRAPRPSVAGTVSPLVG
jgi:hypothetical protein